MHTPLMLSNRVDPQSTILNSRTESAIIENVLRVYDAKITQMLSTCSSHVVQFWTSFVNKRRKLAVSPTNEIRHAHPFSRVPFSAKDEVLLDMLNRVYDENFTEKAFTNVFRDSLFAQRSQTDISYLEAESSNLQPSTDFFSSLRALKSTGRKFARTLFNMKPSQWDPTTHPRPPAYTALECVISGWMSCPILSKIITDINVDHTLLPVSQYLHESYDDLKTRIALDGINRPQRSSYIYGAMHTGYEWLLSIKAVQAQWLPAWTLCESRNIPSNLSSLYYFL